MTESKVVTFTLSPQFASFLEQVHRQHKIEVDTINFPLVALDPGETTGVAVFDGISTIQVYQKETKQIGPAFDWLDDLLEAGCMGDDAIYRGVTTWEHLRIEDYRVYEWKASDHSWSPVHTLRLIGAFQIAAYRIGTPYSFCMASHAKKFWDDNKLKHFDLYPKGLRHGKDALRHLLYYMLFPTKVDQ